LGRTYYVIIIQLYDQFPLTWIPFVLNLSHKLFHTAVTFEMFHVEFVGVLLIRLCTKFHMPTPVHTLVIVITPKAKCRFFTCKQVAESNGIHCHTGFI